MSAPSGGWRSQQDVALPRAIDPNRFAAAREPEILAITEAIKKSEDYGNKFGANGIPRHLRRRTKSHNPYRHVRRPNSKKETAIDEATEGGGSSAEQQQPFTNRKMRRRPAKLLQNALDSAKWVDPADSVEPMQIEDGNTTLPSPRPRRLETHLWHAKRLSMKEYWNGWILPEGEPGRGRGSRSFAKRLSLQSSGNNGAAAVMHDASYWCPILISSASLQGIVNLLKQVTDPEDVQHIFKAVNASKQHGNELTAVLHRPGAFPKGAICPIKLLYLAGKSSFIEDNVEVCIWVHGAAALEAVAALKTAAQQSNDGSAAPALVSATMRDLRRIEIRGSGSDRVVAKALFRDTLPGLLDKLKPGNAVQMTIVDPRLMRPVLLGAVSANLVPHAVSEDTSSSLKFIWNSEAQAAAPLPEAIISKARRSLRERLVLGEESSVISSEIAQELTIQGPTQCSAVLIRHSGPHFGWSIVLPPGWVSPIWHALAFQGCRAVGQREWRWLHTLEKKPFFPDDYPDSSVYNQAMLKTREEREKFTARRPKGARPFSEPPLPPPWGEIVVARSESAMLRAVFGLDGGTRGKVCAGAAARPVHNALQAGKLQWAEKRPTLSAEAQNCFVEASVQFIKRGAAAEGAVLCIIVGEESEHTTECYYVTSTSQTEEESVDQKDKNCVASDRLLNIGYITSPAPCGTGRTSTSMAVCSASAFWRLRSVQYYAPRRDRGTVHAWLKNHNSPLLYPVKISLLIEK